MKKDGYYTQKPQIDTPQILLEQQRTLKTLMNQRKKIKFSRRRNTNRTFKYIYVKERYNPKKVKKKSSKDLNSMYTEYIDEVDTAITECLDKKDINKLELS